MGPDLVLNIEVEVFHGVLMHCHVVEHVADVEGGDDGAVEAPLDGLYGGELSVLLNNFISKCSFSFFSVIF